MLLTALSQKAYAARAVTSRPKVLTKACLWDRQVVHTAEAKLLSCSLSKETFKLSTNKVINGP